jgi:type I restriction enzyme, S subunit
MNLQKSIGWDEAPLESLLDYYIGDDWGKDPNYEDSAFDLAYCIRGSEIRNWNENKGNTASLRKIKKSNINNRKLKEGDILVEISGGGPEQPVGRTILIDKAALNFEPTVPKICTNFLRLIRPKDSINSKFLEFHLKLFYNSGEIVNLQNGSNNLRNLKFPEFLRIKIPFPSLIEQFQIVEKIEELFSELDKGIENLKTAQQQLKVYRQAVLKWAFEGRLTNENVKDGELPEGWNSATLGTYIKKIESGKSYKCDERPPKAGEVGIIKVSSVTWGEFDEQESKTCFSSDLYNERYQVKEGDFLFSRANTLDLVGACVIVKSFNKTLMLSDKILRLHFEETLNKKYALYFLRSKIGKRQISNLSTGNQESMRNIGQEKIKQIIIPFCDPVEQIKVVQEIESRLSVCDKMEETITTSLQQAEALRQSILKRAFEGKLVK